MARFDRVWEVLAFETIIRSAEEIRRPLELSYVRLEDYDAVYVPGGHGPMADLAFGVDMGRLLTAQLASGNPLFIVCHGPVGVKFSRGEIWKPYMVEDRNLVTGQNPASSVFLASRMLEILGHAHEPDVRRRKSERVAETRPH